VLCVILERDTAVIRKIGTLPSFTAMGASELALWKRAAWRLSLPEGRNIESTFWYIVFPAHPTLRESWFLWRRWVTLDIPTWLLRAMAMFRRTMIANPRSRLWWEQFYISRCVDGIVKPLRTMEAAFKAVYQKCVADGGKRADSALGPAAHPVIYPGAGSYMESAWRYACSLDSLALTIENIFEQCWSYDILTPTEVTQKLGELFFSSYARGVHRYHLKHLHNDCALRIFPGKH
jgi:hypothetical protein